MSDKASLRRQIRALHPGKEVRDAQSVEMCRRILESPWYREADVIGGYMPLEREADVTAVLEDALRSGKTLALPRCAEAPRMTFRRVSALSELVPGAYGVFEPAAEAEQIPAEALELLLTPLEAIDPRGMRLGKGGGYYDCLLSGRRIRTMGCALSWQRVERVPADRWDRPLDACAGVDGIDYFEKAMKEGMTHAEKEAAEG